MSDQDWGRQICCHFADDFLIIGGLLENHVVVLDTGVYEDSIKFGEIGQDTLDFALQFVKISQIPL